MKSKGFIEGIKEITTKNSYLDFMTNQNGVKIRRR